MNGLFFDPATAGDTMLARYLRADPARANVFNNICASLDHDGQLGDMARCYIIRNAFRRAVCRGTLAAVGVKLPAWTCETSAAADDNRQFLKANWQRYTRYLWQMRCERRQAAKTEPAPLNDLKPGSHREALSTLR